MRRQYLHLSAYSCDKCRGPVVSASIAVRENEISKGTDVREVGALCLSCGHRQTKAAESVGGIRDFPPVQWDTTGPADMGHMADAYFEALNRAELH